MMKKVLILFTVIFCCKAALAQKELVTLDEHNKFIFYQLVDAPGLKADTLYNRAVAGVKGSKRYQNIKVQFTAGSAITFKTKAMLYTSMTVAKHEAGELAYTFVAEFKDGKYRYWITDFVFAPYQRTRYGVYAKTPGAGEAFEEAKTKFDERTTNNYLEQIAKLGKDIGEEMTVYMAEPVKKTPEPKKIDTRKW